MGKGTLTGTKALASGGAYLSVVALNGQDDRPDLSTLRAFVGTPAQGVSYAQGVWRESLVSTNLGGLIASFVDHNLMTLDGVSIDAPFA